MNKIKIKGIFSSILHRLNAYSSPGLLLRLLHDLLVSNAGMFLGALFTISIWIDNPVIPRYHFQRMFLDTWLESIPLVSLACLTGYGLTGLYGVTRENRFRKILIAVAEGVTAALLIYTFLLYFTATLIPRSMFFAGWFFVFVFMLTGRLARRYFYVHYKLIPLAQYNPNLEEIVRNLTLLSQQDGWVPPEGLPAKGAWPHFEDDEVMSAAAVLRSGKVNQWTGKEVLTFQEEFAAAAGMKYGIALANGTLALELALRGYGIGPGDEVIVTPRTFIASASCAVLQGATPVFADVNRESQNMTAATMRVVITPKTKAIIAVHLAGWPCDMDEIMALAREHGLKVIEDCAQSHGAVYKGRPVGSMGHAAAFSFCQDKIMTTGGEGGMLLTDDEALWERAWAFKDHGKNYESVYHKEHPPGFRWLHDSFGTNWRMTEMQAAIGRRQLRKLPEWVRLRRRNAEILSRAWAGLEGLRLTPPPEEIYHSYYKYYAFVRPERLRPGWDRDRIMNAVVKEGAPCFSGSCSEIYLEKAFGGEGAAGTAMGGAAVEAAGVAGTMDRMSGTPHEAYPAPRPSAQGGGEMTGPPGSQWLTAPTGPPALRPAARLPVAKELGETSLMFLVHPTLTEADMAKVAEAVIKVMTIAGR